jgi:hypothetical protein
MITTVLFIASLVLLAVATFRLGEAKPINFFAAGVLCFVVAVSPFLK